MRNLAGRLVILLVQGFGWSAFPQTPAADSFNLAVNGRVSCFCIQPDGRVILGGAFSRVGALVRSNIARVFPDGGVDETFNPGLNGDVSTLALQPDGNILVGGSFSIIGGQARTNIARLNSDGTVDQSFRAWANGPVLTIAPQSDAKILIGGLFETIDGYSRPYGARLNANGELDVSFSPLGLIFWASGEGLSPAVSCIALQPDGRIFIGGRFDTVQGNPRSNIARLLSWGQLDGFESLIDDYVVDRGVTRLIIQPDEKILVGANWLVRVLASGWLDFDSRIYGGGLALLTDGSMLVARKRLWPDGSLDTNFDMVVGGGFKEVSALAVQADGKILVAGNFTSIGGQNRTNLARLQSPGTATQDLRFNGSTITWLRGGTSPEVWRTTFEYDPDGYGWTNLGPGARMPGGWQLSGLALPTNSVIRARGYVRPEGYSEYIVETTLAPPLSIAAPTFMGSGQFGFSASGPAGRTVAIDTSPDLSVWTALRTNVLNPGPIMFEEARPAVGVQFYRLRFAR